MSIVVYSKPACSQCDSTYRHLDRKKLEYTVIDISEDKGAFDHVMSSGIMSAPLVEVTFESGETHAWGGYNYDEIESLAERLSA